MTAQKMPIVYVAHQLGPDGPQREANRARASRWEAWIAQTFQVATIASWITLSGQWSETQENRDLGLKIDCRLIEVCGFIFLTGGRVSPGMQIEMEHAIARGVRVIDLNWCVEPEDVTPHMRATVRGMLAEAA